MNLRILNCFTCNAPPPFHWRSGTVALLVETAQGLVLVDTGLGLGDYAQRTPALRFAHRLGIAPLDPDETAARQVVRLGYRIEDVRHIVLTHMHFDHCGGLPDFPRATVHVHRREYEAFTGPPRRWTERTGYVRRHIAHAPALALYDDAREKWFDFDAIRLPFEPEMWLVPLFGHSAGLCGVAVRGAGGWHFHASDAAPVNFADDAYEPLVRLVMGPHVPRLRQFRRAHPEIQTTAGHMFLDFFKAAGP